jgi:hypothetical protein
MDPAQNCELMVNQATALVVVMMSYVVTSLRRFRPEPDPLLYHLRSDAEQHRKQTLLSCADGRAWMCTWIPW